VKHGIGEPRAWNQGMRTGGAFEETKADISERIIRARGAMSKRTAWGILELEFSEEDRVRMHELAERNRRGESAAPALAHGSASRQHRFQEPRTGR
jgi:hypothetical protein